MSDTKTPALDHLNSFASEFAITLEFIEFLESNNYAICVVDENTVGRYRPTMETTEMLLSKQFKIDQQACEKERRTLLENWRKSQGMT